MYVNFFFVDTRTKLGPFLCQEWKTYTKMNCFLSRKSAVSLKSILTDHIQYVLDIQ